MSLALVLVVAAAVWILVLVFVLALCRAAKVADQAMEHTLSDPAAGELLHSWWADKDAVDRDLFDDVPDPRASPMSSSRQPPQAPERARDDDPDPPDRPHQTPGVSRTPGLDTTPGTIDSRRTSREDPEAAPTTSWPAPTTAGSITPLRALPLDAAAELLTIDPQTLLRWEQEYGYPQSIGGDEAGQRYYSRIEVIVLADALRRTLSIGSAMRTARSIVGERHTTPGDTAKFTSHSDAPPGA